MKTEAEINAYLITLTCNCPYTTGQREALLWIIN